MKTRRDSFTNEADLTRYLYSEVTEEERGAIEDALFADDELFFEVEHLENELVDKYVAKQLGPTEAARFERSLAVQPERQRKVANAVALQEFISEERSPQPPVVAPVESSFWEKVSNLFSVGAPNLAFGMGGLLLVVVVLSVFLALDNRRKADEVARLQAERTQTAELDRRLAELQQSETELQRLIDSERENSGDLTEELQNERLRQEQMEAELRKLRQDQKAAAPETRRPVIATLVLSPLASRGGTGAIRDLKIAATTKKVSLQLGLPDQAKPEERYSVSLNTKPIARNLTPRTAQGGKTINVTLASKDLDQGLNRIAVTGRDGDEIAKYMFNVEKK